ncbi:hypothetical protein FRB97_001059 [Tulasnella sp. 331]|nr:hypothetical protein FRB97_001059 [Tulasnella sp. 331]
MESDDVSTSGGETSFSNGSDGADFTAWDDLLQKQNSMYKNGMRRMAELEARFNKLQDEVEVWRMGYNTKAREKEELEAKVAILEEALGLGAKKHQYPTPQGDTSELETKVANLERDLTAIHEENQLVICLIDGDGAVFSESFLTRGKEGGRDAAASLIAGIKANIDSHNSSLSRTDRNISDPSQGRIISPQIICTVFFNRMGLCKTLLANNFCTAQNFLDFFIGFNQASPLVTLVDVGDGKEAADAKLRGESWHSLALHTRLPQTRKVFFGGAHDNGYVPILRSLDTEGHAHKLVILRGHTKMAHEFETYLDDTSTDVIAIPGLFLEKKIPPTYQHRKSPSFAGAGSFPSNVNAGGRVTPEDRGSPARQAPSSKSPQKPRKQKAASNGPAGTSPIPTPALEHPSSSMSAPGAQTPQETARQVDLNKSTCKFAHNYDFSAVQVEQFRRELAAKPVSRSPMDSNVRSISSGDTSSSRSNDEADTTAWDDMIYAQNAMYKASIKKNAVLQSQVVRLQDELEVWKIGFNSKAQEKEELTAKVARLESVISTMADQQRCGKDKEILEAKVAKLEHHLITIHEENPMVVCLMDGNQRRALRDGAVFSETFLTRGKEGGRDAAASLNTAIRNHVDIYNNNIFGGTSSVSGNDSAFGSTPRRIVHPQIVCTIYMNRAGLSKTLFSNSVCTPQNYLDFFIGFNQALPLFTLVDVGDGKEAADTKLRKSLELYARLPQVRKIFFAGAHDNGYLPTLISLGTEGQLDKLVIIKGHAMAYEFDMFLQETSVDVIALPNLFLRQKLLSSGALNSKPHSFALPSKSSYPSGTSSASIGHATTGSPPTPRGQNSSTRPTSPTKSPQKNQKQIQQAAASGDRFDPKKVSTNMAVRSNAGQHDKLPATTQRQSVARQTPPACIAFYLDRTKCRYDKVSGVA